MMKTALQSMHLSVAKMVLNMETTGCGVTQWNGGCDCIDESKISDND